MSSSGSVFSQTLQTITTAKLTELSKKRSSFEDQKATLLKAVQAETDQKKRLCLLLNGVQDIFQIGPKHGRFRFGEKQDASLEVLLYNIRRFLDQARLDPTVSPKLLQDWERSLIKPMDIQSLKYQYATLYGDLVTEWLSTKKAGEPSDTADEEFEKVGLKEKEKDELRAEWENIVFQPFEVDQMAIGSFLTELFGKNGTEKKTVEAFAKMRRSLESFQTRLSSPEFNDQVLHWVINGLLSSDLLDEERRAVLKDFLGNSMILGEIADVLNMRMSSLQTWSWEEHVLLEMRRKVNGDSQVYMHEDLLQAIFLQFIGVKWSVFFKDAFKNFSESWACNSTEIPVNDTEQREFFLGSDGMQTRPSVQSTRRALYHSQYFMAQLIDDATRQVSTADGEVEANYESQVESEVQSKKKMVQQQPVAQGSLFGSQATQSAPASAFGAQATHTGRGGGLFGATTTSNLFGSQATQNTTSGGLFGSRTTHNALPNMFVPGTKRGGDSWNDVEHEKEEDQKPRSAMQTKQDLLHLISSEIIINTELHGEITCLHSAFESWAPNLPHSTILSVLGFLGVSKKWLGFFEKFLEAPLLFSEDGPSGQVRKRKRGVPASHALSDVFGEVVLFCMDYSVNQSTSGTFLYRMHDEFWIWSTSHQTVVTAWNTISEFASIMGVSLNHSKTGTVRIMKDKEAPVIIDPALPKGEIRWGFLYLDSSTGRFLIDQRMVDTHISELERQLKGKTSIFSYIQAWNTYTGTFFLSNFGKPANCFGREHVDMMLSTLERIQRCIFPTTTPGSGNSVATHLKAKIEKRFGVKDIPDGFLYFTTPLGGLELQNPFIRLLQIRDSLWEDPSKAFSDFFEAEKEDYDRAKKAFIQRMTFGKHSSGFGEQGISEKTLAFGQTRLPSGFGQPRTQSPFGQQKSSLFEPSQVPASPPIPEFFSFQEFTRYREYFRNPHVGGLVNIRADLLVIYKGLLKTPKEGESVLEDDRMAEALKALGSMGVAKNGEIAGIGRDWRKMSKYWRWVLMMYGGEMIDRFGGLNAVDPGVLPVGMVELFKEGRVKWEG